MQAMANFMVPQGNHRDLDITAAEFVAANPGCMTGPIPESLEEA